MILLNKHKLKPLVLLVFISVILLLLNGCQNYAKDDEQFTNSKKIVIRFSHVVGEDTPKGEAARKFAELIKEKSNGKMEVQVFANGSLYRDGEEWDALQSGKIQMIAPALSKMTSKVPKLELFDLPFIFKDLEQVHRLTDGKIGNLIYQSAKSYHVEPLAIWDNGFKQFTNNRNQLHLPKDFIGLTFRIMPSQILQEQFNVLGAKAEVRNFNDVYKALSTGEIDGQENTISNIYTKRFHEVQKYLTISNHGYLGYLVMINKDFWNKLSPRNQQLILTTMNEVTKWERNKAKEIQAEQLQEIKKSKSIKIETMTGEERQAFREKYASLYRKVEAGLDKSIVKEMKTLLSD